MKFPVFILITLIGLSSVGCASTAEASSRAWLGEKRVSDRAEFDVFKVGAGKGTFNALQVKIDGPPVELKRVKIHFTNGSVQVIEKNRLLGRNSTSSTLDLSGRNRLIDEVVFYYETRSPGWNSAELTLFGLR